MEKRFLNFKGVFGALMIAALGAGLLVHSAAVGEGVRRGISICGNVLIPALFPFMALSCYLTRTDAARILSIPLYPVTTGVFRLRSEFGATVLLSVIGGYPVGAKMISNLLEQGRIDKPTAERMLCFCFGGSPSFIIAAVGVGMFGNRRVGILLFAAQALATVIVGWLFSLNAPNARIKGETARQKGGMSAFVAAAGDASSAMISMCAYAVLFSGLISLLSSVGISSRIADILPVGQSFADACLAGLLEVTSGCLYASRLSGSAAIAMTSVICSFGGLSIVFQVMSCFREKLRFGPFLLSRLLHGGISAAVSVPLCRAFVKGISEVMLPGGRPVPQTGGRSLLPGLLLLAMCSMVVLGRIPARAPKKVDSI